MIRKFTHQLAFCAAALLMLATSCKKDETKAVISSNPTGGTLSASATTVSLSKTTLTSNAVTFSSTNPNFGYSAGVTSTLQIAAKGTNFASPKEVVLSGKNVSQSYTVQDFNAVLLAFNMATGVSGQVEVRMKYTPTSTSTTTVTPVVYSNVLTITATPFALASYLYVPGAYQNWTPATADSLVSPTSNGVYTGFVYFSSDKSFKITPAKNWNASYGDAGSGTISLSASGNLSAPGAGMYQLTVNTTKGTISYVYYGNNWSVIGDAAQGWSTDVATTFNSSANTFTTTTSLLASGGYKFRADNNWTLSLGDVSPVTGQLTSNNGANIAPPATAGKYLITLNFGNPLTAPSYTVVKQ